MSPISNDFVEHCSTREIEQLWAKHLVFLQDNLTLLGVNDPEVTVVYHINFFYTSSISRCEWKGKLSKAVHFSVCGSWPWRFERNHCGFKLHNEQVFLNDQMIGYIDVCGFRFTQLASLRDAIAWIIVKKWEYPPFTFNLDDAVGELHKVVKEGVTADIFARQWQETLKRVFRMQPGMMTQDAYRASECYLWRAATADVHGEAHPGYPDRIVDPIQSSLIRVL